MNSETGASTLWKRINKIDWKLLILLLLFLDVKLVIKIAAILLAYILRPDFRFGFRIKNSRLPLFYLLVIGIAVFNWLTGGLITDLNYNLVLLTCFFFWLLCILAIHQVKLSVERNNIETIHRTILVFFIINAIASLTVYAGIIWETGAMNPYTYQGNFQKYFMGTGDYIKGITMDTSTTNAVLNGLGVIYFLLRNKNLPALMCMVILLLTGSNISNLVLSGTLLYVFISQSTKTQKSMIVVCLLMLVVFFVKVSPQNNQYITSAWQKLFNKFTEPKPVFAKTTSLAEQPDSILTAGERKQKFALLYLDSVNKAIFKKKDSTFLVVKTSLVPEPTFERPVIPKPSIHTAPFQHRNDTTVLEKDLLKFADEKKAAIPAYESELSKKGLPGKLIAFEQLAHYFKAHPYKLVTGAGAGNFSSKLAFRATAMKISGGYPARFLYINNDFKSNHLALYLYYFTRADEMHSIANSPNSTYGLLLGEYGLAGFFSFLIFYAWFFKKRLQKSSYGFPLLLFMLSVFFVEYWFEQLSVVVFFELLVLLNIKETADAKG